ncbi:PIN-like domain-containing protein [Nocardia sp. NPDC003345]
MKTILSEWYGPSEPELAEFYRVGTIALDANILLSLYRVNGTQRRQIIAALEKVSDRLWIPYQVALEYQRNRLEVAAEVNSVFDSIEAIPRGSLQKILDDASAAIRELAKKTSTTIRDRDIRERVSNEFFEADKGLKSFMESRQADMAEAFQSVRKDHTIDFDDVKNDDPVRSALDRILSPHNIGEKLDEEVLTSRRLDAQSRIASLTPPGYKDANSKKDPTGDCLIWFELLDHAEKQKRPVLFVTDDVKEDFYVKAYGKTIGPRPELVREMHESTGQKYHQTTLDAFLRSANRYLDAAVEETTITTVKSARESSGSFDQFANISKNEYEMLRTIFSLPGNVLNRKSKFEIPLGLIMNAKEEARKNGDVRFLSKLNRYERMTLTNFSPADEEMTPSIESIDDGYSELHILRRHYSRMLNDSDLFVPVRYDLAFEIAKQYKVLGHYHEARQLLIENLNDLMKNAERLSDALYQQYLTEFRDLLTKVQSSIFESDTNKG